MTSPYHVSTVRLFFIIVMLSGFISYGQSLNQNWKQELAISLEEFLKCSDSGNKEDCNSYTGKSLHTVYRLNDFYSPPTKRYMTVNEIANFLKSSDKWHLLGQSYDQKTLTDAQDLANAKKAVVAVYMNAAGMGHAVLIVPGELKPSGSWGLNVPSTASFFPTEPTKSFVDKGLSFAFMKQMLKDVAIYAREY